MHACAVEIDVSSVQFWKANLPEALTTGRVKFVGEHHHSL